MPNLRMKLLSALTVCFGLLAFGGAAPAQTGDPRCTNLCVAIVQSVGDEVKEQIALDCIQTTGRCSGQGHFQAGQVRTPVSIEGELTGPILTLRIRGEADSTFVPMDADALILQLAPDLPRQAAQFVVHERIAGVPFAREGSQLALTVLVQRLVTPQ